MENANIGVANLIVSNKLKNSYFDSKLIEESKKIAFDFFDVIKNSPILQLEFKVFNNIENKHIDNDLIATRYIDSNIKLFEVYTINEIESERNKLSKFINEHVNNDEIDTKKIKLYMAIDNLIKESLNDYSDINVDAIHESFELILNHIKSPKSVSTINENVAEDINEDVIEIAVDKFNEKYKMLNEDDRNLIKTLINSNENEKKAILETYKTESIAILENSNNDGVKEKINAAITKINEIKFSIDTVNNDIINLHELKKGLIND